MVALPALLNLPKVAAVADIPLVEPCATCSLLVDT